MDKRRQHRTSADQAGFRLPPDVSFSKQVLAQGSAYEFRHQDLGQLGRFGPALGSGPMMERPAEILKVWPAREPVLRQSPAEFNAMLDLLRRQHCR